ncbi:hypothetical protein NC653_010222 [Populus alba x Populus x berolinensis]|uniref:Endonuclease/exonuclease/phosphatase domain-containing protein n=1 Tax=Populus alba x Populus x berolinensis TaxID=444605 RepID=A0AAD6W4Z6_9ROSI|nr:hypothetical protein NC653_010222 [Populus alba x Populus x berolinensis]
MNTRSSWADLASNSADESTNAGSSANNESGRTAGNAPTRSTYVPPHLRNRSPSSDPPAGAFSGSASSNDRPGYGGGSRWGVPRNDYRGGYGSGGGRQGEVVGIVGERERNESDGASVKLVVFQGARASNKGVSVLTKDTNSVAVFGSLKILSYNVWFRADLEMHRRMEALGELIQLHSPDVICLQEVIPDIYDIFQQSSWWRAYQCYVSSEIASSRGYFCMQVWF